MKRTFVTLVAGLALASMTLGASNARAEPTTTSTTVRICYGALEPEVVAACAVVALIAHELFIADKPFGKNGEIASALRKARDEIGHRTGLQKPVKRWGKRIGIKM